MPVSKGKISRDDLLAMFGDETATATAPATKKISREELLATFGDDVKKKDLTESTGSSATPTTPALTTSNPQPSVTPDAAPTAPTSTWESALSPKVVIDNNPTVQPAQPTNPDAAAYFDDKYDSFLQKAHQDLQDKYPGKNVEIKTVSRNRNIDTQKEIMNRGASTTDVSLHNFGAARDFQIFVDGRPVKDSKIYHDILWKNAEDSGLHHLDPNGFGATDLGHIGVLEEDGQTTFGRLIKEYPQLRNTDNYKASISFLKNKIDNNTASAKEKSVYEQLTANPEPTEQQSTNQIFGVDATGQPIINTARQEVKPTPQQLNERYNQSASHLASQVVEGMQENPQTFDTYHQISATTPLNVPGNPVHDISDLHGDPEMTGGFYQHRKSELDRQRNVAIQQAAQSDASALVVNDINKQFDDKINALKQSTSDVTALQLFNKEITQKALTKTEAAIQLNEIQKAHEKEVEAVNEQFKEDTNPSQDKRGKYAASVGIAEKERDQKLHEIAQKYSEQAGKVKAQERWDGVRLGIEQQRLLGDKQAEADAAAYDAGRPISPAANYRYQNIGKEIMEAGTAAAEANGQNHVVETAKSHIDTPEKIENDNKPFLKTVRAQAIGNAGMKEESDWYHAIFPHFGSMTNADKLRLGREQGLTDEQINEIDNKDIPTSATLWQQGLSGAFNAPAPIYERGVRTLAALAGANPDAVNARFHQGWENELGSGLGAAIQGNIPSDQNTFTSVRNVLGQMASTLGNLSTFAGEVGGVAKGLEATGMAASKADKLANFSVMAFQGYNDGYHKSLEVIGDKPEDEWKRQILALTDGLTTGAIFSISPKAKLIKNALGLETKTGEQFLKELNAAKGIESLEELKPSMANYIHEISKELGTQVTLATAQKMSENIMNKIANPKREQSVDEDLGTTAATTAITMLLPSILGGVGHVQAQTPLNKATMFEVGSNPSPYIADLNSRLASGKITPQEAAQSHDAILQMKAIVDQTPTMANGKPLTPDQIKDYSWNLMQRNILTDRLKKIEGQGETIGGPDEAQIDPIKKQINDLKAERSKIFKEAGVSRLPVPPEPVVEPEAAKETPIVEPAAERSVATEAESEPAADQQKKRKKLIVDEPIETEAKVEPETTEEPPVVEVKKATTKEAIKERALARAEARKAKEKAEAIEPEKPTEHATPQSEEQQQESGTEGSKPEHAPVEQAIGETKSAETKNSDSNISGSAKAKEKVTTGISLGGKLKLAIPEDKLQGVQLMNVADLHKMRTPAGPGHEPVADMGTAGIREPLEVIRFKDGTYQLQNGNHRLDEAMRLGAEKLPVIIKDEKYSAVKKVSPQKADVYSLDGKKETPQITAKPKKVSVQAQKLADVLIGTYNGKQGGKWAPLESMYNQVRKRLADWNPNAKHTQAQIDKHEADKIFFDHTEKNPPKRSKINQAKRGTSSTADQAERAAVLDVVPHTIDEWAKQELLGIKEKEKKGETTQKDKFSLESVERHFATRKGSTEQRYATPFVHKEGGRNLDQWANAIANDPKTWPEGLNLSDPEAIKEAITPLLTNYKNKSDITFELARQFKHEGRLGTKSVDEHIAELERRHVEEMERQAEAGDDLSHSHQESEQYVPEQYSPEKYSELTPDEVKAHDVIDATNHELTDKDIEVIDNYLESVTKDGVIDENKIDPFDDKYQAALNHPEISDAAKKYLDFLLNPGKGEEVLKTVQTIKNERAKQREADTAAEDGEIEGTDTKGKGEPAVARTPDNAADEGTSEANTEKLNQAIDKSKKGGISNDEYIAAIQKANELREKAKSLENKSDLDSQSRRYSLLDEANKIQNDAAAKIAPFEKVVDTESEMLGVKSKKYNETKCRELSKAHQKEYGGKYEEIKVTNPDGTEITHAVVLHDDYVYEPQSDALIKKNVFDDYFKTDISGDKSAEIKAGYKKAADAVRGLKKTLLGEGEKNTYLALGPISPKSVGKFIDKVADLIEKIGNLHVAVHRAIEWLKAEHPNEKVSLNDIAEIKDKIAPILDYQTKEPLFTGKYADDIRETAEDYQDGIDNGDISHAESVSEIMELPDLTDQERSEIINYLDWHNADKYSARREENEKARNSANPIKTATFKDSGLMSDYLGVKTTEEVFGKEGLFDDPKEKKVRLVMENVKDNIHEFVNLYKTDPNQPISEWGSRMLGDIKQTGEDPFKQVAALSGLHIELQSERIKNENELNKTQTPERRNELLQEGKKIQNLIASTQNLKKKILSKASEVMNVGRVDRMFRDEMLFEHYEKAILSEREAKQKKAVEDALNKSIVEDYHNHPEYIKERKLTDEAAASKKRKAKEDKDKNKAAGTNPKEKKVAPGEAGKPTPAPEAKEPTPHEPKGKPDKKAKESFTKGKKEAENSFGRNEKGEKMTAADFLEHLKKLKNPC